VACHNCSIDMVKAGRGQNGAQRFSCQQCGKRFQEAQQRPFGADSRLPKETATRIPHCFAGAIARAELLACATWKSAQL
jgi:transposase-like protein